MNERKPESATLSASMERRKHPLQHRSKVTVANILRAARELVETEADFSTIGTKEIAERAGVNIGSLYHFFPNRESILLSLYEEVAADGAHKVNLLAMRLMHQKPELAVPRVMKLLLTHYQENATILLRMVRDVPEIRRSIRVISFENVISNFTRQYLQQHSEYKSKDMSCHTFFLENIIFSNMQRYAMDPPPNVSTAQFLARLSYVVTAYLKGA
jgi:AcrR family transcriptional regulator